MFGKAHRWWGALAPLPSIGEVPNQPATPNRTIRVPDDVWEPAMAKAHAEGITLTDVIIRALKAYLRD